MVFVPLLASGDATDYPSVLQILYDFEEIDVFRPKFALGEAVCKVAETNTYGAKVRARTMNVRARALKLREGRMCGRLARYSRAGAGNVDEKEGITLSSLQ